MEISDEAFTMRRSVRAVPQVDHVTHLGGISPPDWQTKTCAREVKTAGMEYMDLASQGLTLSPPYCAGGGRTPQRLQGVEGFVPPANRSRASLRGDS